LIASGFRFRRRSSVDQLNRDSDENYSHNCRIETVNSVNAGELQQQVTRSRVEEESGSETRKLPVQPAW